MGGTPTCAQIDRVDSDGKSQQSGQCLPGDTYISHAHWLLQLHTSHFSATRADEEITGQSFNKCIQL